ncbi:MAG: alkyl sulfatase dimerization domain-containing protein [Halioglobus sp.]
MQFKSSLLILFMACLLAGCGEQSAVPVSADGSTKHTQAVLRSTQDAMPADETDFEQAVKGLIASPADLRVLAANGDLAWDQTAYDFVEGQAPATVNPSLWRQARLNGIHGLFEVTPGIYQLRGFDLANMTIVVGESGWILVDPLTTAATSRAALAFAREQLGNQPIKAVLFTHSHIDHFGGVDGVLTDQEREGLRVIAPVGFMEEAVSENLLAGSTMQRRATFMYGRNLPVSAVGHVDTGLGKEPARGGQVGILAPTDIISETGQSLLIDGVQFEFQNAGGSEAPAEFTFYLPQLNAFSGAEVMSRNMHNVYTLRGAKVRDALAWSSFIDEALVLFGTRADVYFASHHWPIWGRDAIVSYMESQRDTYKYIHDQTLRLANQGATPKEIAQSLRLPSSLAQQYSSRGYYGTVSHNAKAVYQRYFGWYDGNPANLNPHPPTVAGARYVEFMGGAEAVLEKATLAFDEGDYRWVAEVVNHLVFAQPENREAKALLARTYEQLGYQAESGPWRDAYLTGAYELRNGPPEHGTDMSDAAGLIREIPTALFFQAMAVSLNGERADGEDYVINIVMSDTQEQFVLSIENAVLHARAKPAQENADAGITLTRELFLNLVTGQANIQELLFSDDLSLSGSKLALVGFFSLFDQADPVFNVVTP